MEPTIVLQMPYILHPYTVFILLEPAGSISRKNILLRAVLEGGFNQRAGSIRGRVLFKNAKKNFQNSNLYHFDLITPRLSFLTSCWRDNFLTDKLPECVGVYIYEREEKSLPTYIAQAVDKVLRKTWSTVVEMTVDMRRLY